MILTDIAKQVPGFTPNLAPGPHLEISNILDDLARDGDAIFSYIISNEHDTRPPGTSTYIELGGPTLAKYLEVTTPHNAYPKAALQVTHVDNAMPFQQAVAAFRHSVHAATEVMPDLQHHGADPQALVASLAHFYVILSLAPGHTDNYFAQVHYDERGIALPHDIGVTIGKATDHNTALRYLNTLKNLAIATFGHQRINPFPSQVRQVEIPTSTGLHTVAFEYLLPDGN
mgnify:CR=1 FL=1